MKLDNDIPPPIRWKW